MNLLILTILIYRNGHFVSIRLIQMQRRNTCLPHILLEISLRSSFQPSSNSLLRQNSKRGFLGAPQSQRKNGWQDHCLRSPPHLHKLDCELLLHVWLAIPHHTHVLILPCKCSSFYFQFFYWHIVGAKKKYFFPFCLPIWIRHLLPWLHVLLFNNF